MKTDLDEKRSAFKAERQKKQRTQRIQAGGFLLVGLVLVVGAMRWSQREPTVTGPSNQATRFARVLPLVEMNDINGDWIGVVSSSWAGLTDPELAAQDCSAALKLIDDELSADGTLFLLGPDGEPVVECTPD